MESNNTNPVSFFSSIDLSKHSSLQIGKIGEYWAKLMLSLYGLDIYTSEVDEKGIDFVIRIDDSRHLDIQVKTIRLDRTSYAYVFKKGAWEQLRKNLFLVLICIDTGQPPKLYLIPSIAWKNENNLLRYRKYDKPGQKSKPEWGLNISKKNRGLLEEYRIDIQVEKMKQHGWY